MILPVSSGLCAIVLLAHSLFFRPHRATGLILLFCIPAAALYGGKDFYVINVAAPVIKFNESANTIPLVQLVGFFFAFYCALSISVHIFEFRLPDGTRAVPFFKLLASTVIITIFMGLGIEYANFTIQWWSWQTHKVDVNWLQLIGAWGWRPLLIMPILLQFFIARPAKPGFKCTWRLLVIVPIIITSRLYAARLETQLHLLVFAFLLLIAVMLLWLIIQDVIPALVRIFRDKQLRRVFLLCAAWFVFFLTWMIIIDPFIPASRASTNLLWLGLIALARIKSPVVSLKHLQYERPAPLFRRNKTSPKPRVQGKLGQRGC